MPLVPAASPSPAVFRAVVLCLPLAALGCGGRVTPPGDSTDSAIDSGPTPAACSPDGELAWPLVPDGNDPILVFDVTTDPAHHRAWSTSLMTPTLAEIDTETATLVKVHNLGDFKPDHEQVQVDGDGNPWVVSAGVPALQKLDRETGVVTTYAPELDTGASLVGRPGGGVWVTGLDGEVNVLLRVDADGTVSARRELEYPALTLTASVDGGVAALIAVSGREQQVWVVDGEGDLATLDSCPVGSAGKFMTQLRNGDFVVTSNTTVANAPCATDAPTTVTTVGTDNKEVFAEGDGFLVLDRQGDATSALGPNWGVARHFDAQLHETGTPFSTGKHTGYGGRDTNTGYIWANSEGTTEVWALDPVSGTVAHEVRVGVNVETVLPDPLRPGTAIVTGRLSSTVGRLDACTGAFTEAEGTVTWPIAPVLHDDILYVIDQLTTRIQRFDAATLTVLDTLDTGLGDNELLTFDHLLWHPDRGTLFLSQSATNTLYEIDPASGGVRGSWPLSGALITDPTLIGRVQLVLAGGHVVAVRPRDGTITVVDPDAEQPVASFAIEQQDMRAIDADRLDLVWASADGTRLYVGPHAWDAGTWARVPDEDVDAIAVFAESDDGERYGWSYEDARVARFAADGRVTWESPATVSEQGDPSVHLVPEWDDRIVYSTFEHATIRVMPGAGAR